MIIHKNHRYKSLLDFQMFNQYRLRVYTGSHNRFHVTVFSDSFETLQNATFTKPYSMKDLWKWQGLQKCYYPYPKSTSCMIHADKTKITVDLTFSNKETALM